MNLTLTIVCLTGCAILLMWARTANAASYRHLRNHVHPCLAEIIDRENPSWNPTVYNRQGSGAYGLPQALPGSKMRSAGADWRTNPWTQIRWMRSYVIERYGGYCEALAFWRAHRWY